MHGVQGEERVDASGTFMKGTHWGLNPGPFVC